MTTYPSYPGAHPYHIVERMLVPGATATKVTATVYGWIEIACGAVAKQANTPSVAQRRHMDAFRIIRATE